MHVDSHKAPCAMKMAKEPSVFLAYIRAQSIMCACMLCLLSCLLPCLRSLMSSLSRLAACVSHNHIPISIMLVFARVCS